jgi:hypothetical protein
LLFVRFVIVALLMACSPAEPSREATTCCSSSGRLPPRRPSTTLKGETRWFAVSEVKLGFTPRNGTTKDPNAWRDYGYDLDQRATTAEDSATSRESCKRRDGSLTKFLQDGNDGVDNNFGQHVLWSIESFKPGSEEFVNDGLKSGRYTLIFRIDNFTTQDNASAPGMLYLGGDFAEGKAKPTFAATEKWPINPLSLADGKTIAKPKVMFTRGYISQGYWVSGDLGKDVVDLGPMLSGADISLPVESAVVTVKLDGTDGTIAGAVNTAKLQTGLAPVARRLGLCEGNTAYQEVVKTLSLAADLVAGAPNLQDTSRECDAISLGYGFTMKPTGEPTSLMVAATEPAPDTCK